MERLMLRISHLAAPAAVVAMLLAEPALAHAHAYRHHTVYRHYAALTYRHHFAFASRGYFAPAPRWRNESGFAPFGAANSGYASFGSDNGAYADQSAWQNGRANYSGGTAARRSEFEGMVEQQASANGVPSSLVHRVIMRESGYNPRAVSSGNYGLMQIRLGTARAMGYSGSAAGLLDPETNMTYAVRYLAGAYRAAGGNENGAVALYARGYNAPRVQEASLQTWAPAASGRFYASADEGTRPWSADTRVAEFNFAANPGLRSRRHSYYR
jgi:soluble lytic murein transglycosylase-like protein